MIESIGEGSPNSSKNGSEPNTTKTTPATRLLINIEPSRESTPLDPRVSAVLTHIGQGKSLVEIGKIFSLNEQTIHKIAISVSNDPKPTTILEAVLIGLQRGLVEPSNILDEIDRKKLHSLKGYEIELLEALIQDNGKDKSNPKLADLLTIPVGRVEKRLISIHKRLGTKNKEQTAAVYKSAKILPDDEQEERRPELTEQHVIILNLKARGRTDIQIAQELMLAESTVRKHLGKAFKILRVTSSTEAIITAMSDNIISPESVLHDFDRDRLREQLKRLDLVQRTLLDALIADGGKAKTNKQLKEDCQLKSVDQVNYFLDTARRVLGTKDRYHTAAVYAAVKMLGFI